MDVEISRKCHSCGANKVVKADCLGPLLDVEMLEKCKALWREARLEVKKVKAHHVWRTFRGRVLNLAKSGQNARALQQFQMRWQALDV